MSHKPPIPNKISDVKAWSVSIRCLCRRFADATKRSAVMMTTLIPVRTLVNLTQGQRVVASGQFLIDSEASLKGVLARLGTQPREAP